MKFFQLAPIAILVSSFAGCVGAGDVASEEEGLSRPRRYTRDEAQRILAKYEAYSLDQLDQAFAAGGVPKFYAFKGDTAGAFLAQNPKNEWWSKPTTDLLFTNTLVNWTGKRFIDPFSATEMGSGVNLFDNDFAPESYWFDTYVKDSFADGKSCLALDYRSYPGPMAGLLDDVKTVERGVMLGQMWYYFPWRDEPVFVGYFMLVALK